MTGRTVSHSEGCSVLIMRNLCMYLGWRLLTERVMTTFRHMQGKIKDYMNNSFEIQIIYSFIHLCNPMKSMVLQCM